MTEKPIIAVWFSCGAASAVTAKITLARYSEEYDVRIINSPVKQEHPDNLRFLLDVQKWLGVKIHSAVNPKYPTGDTYQVWIDRSFISGIKGAPCTMELKKEARYFYEQNNNVAYHVLGFDVTERGRFNRFIKEERPNALPVLIDAGLTKQDCYDILKSEGIEPPHIYAEGFPNANCIGCVKATSPTYWNLVRRTHPKHFWNLAALSRMIGCKLVRYKKKRIYLDELPENANGRPIKNMKIECGLFCDMKKSY